MDVLSYSEYLETLRHYTSLVQYTTLAIAAGYIKLLPNCISLSKKYFKANPLCIFLIYFIVIFGSFIYEFYTINRLNEEIFSLLLKLPHKANINSSDLAVLSPYIRRLDNVFIFILAITTALILINSLAGLTTSKRKRKTVK